jgi:predicted amidohydrolase YtcJ
MNESADVIINAGRIYPMDPTDRVFRSIAIRDGWIVAVSEHEDGLEGLRGDRTAVVFDPALTVLPAIFDTHEHLFESARRPRARSSRRGPLD